jgi:DNA polymerase III delta subunit
MVILLQGPDEYRRRLKREAVIAEFVKKHGSSGVGRFDVDEDGADPLSSFLQNQSIFSPVRLAVVDHPFSADAKTLPALIESFQTDPNTTLLLSDAGKPSKGWAFLSGRSKKAKPDVLTQTFDYLAGADWTAFIRAEAAARGVKLSAGALKLIGTAFIKDTWRLITELEKLSLSGTKEIVEDDLQYLSVDLAPDFWAFVNSFRSQELGTRLAALESAFARNEPPAKLFHVLAYQMKEKLPRFAAYDLAVKSGKLEYEEALVDAVLY